VELVTVIPVTTHPAIVVVERAVCVIVKVIELLVESQTITVQMGTAVLPVHEEKEEDDDELADVLVVVDDSMVEVDVLLSSSRSYPRSASVSVKFLISSRSGSTSLTASTEF
jgi:hypothetical protein